jgi:hypothetical protein
MVIFGKGAVNREIAGVLEGRSMDASGMGGDALVLIISAGL